MVYSTLVSFMTCIRSLISLGFNGPTNNGPATLQVRAAPVDRRGWSEHEKLAAYETIPVYTISLVCSAAAGGRFCALACRAENRHILSGSRTMANEISGRTEHRLRHTPAGHRIRTSAPKQLGFLD